jgi:sporulation protein YlmC with PRC-barrel domain
MTERTGANLVRLSDTGQTVADPAEDVRGRKVLDAAGDDVGTVHDLLVDDEETRVRMLRVEHGGFLGIGADHFLVPVEAVTSVTPDAVHIDRERARLTDVPRYDPEMSDTAANYGDLYGWWGFPPFYGAGAVYPPYPYYR